MRVVAVVLTFAAVLSATACAPAARDTAAEPTPVRDSLLKAASLASTRTPVRIAGYAFLFNRKKTRDDGMVVEQIVGEIVVTKDGKVLREREPQGDRWHRNIFWRKGLAFEAPVERLSPELDTERQARTRAESLAVASDPGTRKYGPIKPYIRRYLVQDADGVLYYIKPDGSDYWRAPAFDPLDAPYGTATAR